MTVTGIDNVLAAIKAAGWDQVRDNNNEVTLVDDIDTPEPDGREYVIGDDTVILMAEDGRHGAKIWTRADHPRLTKSGTPDKRPASLAARNAEMGQEKRVERAKAGAAARWSGPCQWTIRQIGGTDWADGIADSRKAAQDAAEYALSSRCAQGFAARGSQYTVTVYPEGTYGEGARAYVARDVVEPTKPAERGR